MPDNSNKPDFIVVIRASGERTTGVCKKLVAGQTMENPVHVVQEYPFKKALESCFKIAIESSRKWLITVDADMLLLPGAVATLLRYAEEMPENYLQLQGRIFDNITGSVRKAGPRIYRTEFLEDALGFSENSDDQIRPESYVLRKLGSRYPSRYIREVTCVHDFEQYYADLYRKARVHAKKHRELIPDIVLRAADQMEENPDFLIILKAVWDGLLGKGNVSIDARLYTKQAMEALKELGLQEKPSAPDFSRISLKMKGWSERFATEVSHPGEIHDQPIQNHSIAEKFKIKFHEGEFLKNSIHNLGSMLVKAGKRMQKK